MNSKELETRVKECIENSEIYSPENDTVMIDAKAQRNEPIRSVIVDYCKLQYSNVDSTYKEIDIPLDENGELLYTGFGLIFHLETGKITGQLNVHPKYRGKNIGKQLVTLMEEIAKSLGLKSIKLEDPTSLEFFEHLGYTPEGEYLVKEIVQTNKEKCKTI